ncbi:MAG: hypothetical protein GQ536_09730 [Candidatus Aminicenantes bacterium]|nr:hypothetical protein [Candidatus Aminicenantes bacterium]
MTLTKEEIAEALHNAKDWRQLAIEDREKKDRKKIEKTQKHGYQKKTNFRDKRKR